MRSSASFEQRQGFERRLLALRVGAVVCFGLLALAFWLLQVVQHDKYGAWADRNYLREIPLRAPRGVLYDRYGRVLVENRDSYTIALLRDRTANLDDAVKRLAAALELPESRIREPLDRAIANEPVFRPVPIVEHATLDQVVAVRARQVELPEVEVLRVPVRRYPAERLAAHLFGYVSEIRQEQIGRPDFQGLEPGAIVGQTGIERIYNARLMGADGRRNVIVNSVGREIETLGREDPREGHRLQLTIDLDLQQALEDAFDASGFSGAAAFIDPRNGEVLAMTSLPAYDPNDFAGRVNPDVWAGLNTDGLRPLTNRLIQGRYAPGSTFKIVTAIAALAEGLIDPDHRVTCRGGGTFHGNYFQCHRREGHGSVDLREAIEKSCNVYFYSLGERLKIDTIHAYAAKLGLTGRTGIDLPGELESLVPSTEWKRRVFNEPWYPGETISVSIGQGAVSVTPLALATMIATVANGGTLVTPHLLRAVDSDGQGWTPWPTAPARSQVLLPPDHLQAIRDGLWLAVNRAGTGGRARIEGRDVAGKTGTAQVISIAGAKAAAGKIDTRDHGFFVFFAPRDNPRIAGIVFAEHSEHGYTAAPIAKYVMETFFNKLDGLPPPAMPATLRTTTATPTPATGPPQGQGQGQGQGQRQEPGEPEEPEDV